MERRTFIAGTFGLVSLAALGAVGLCDVPKASSNVVTQAANDLLAAPGPAMVPGIELMQVGETTQGWYGKTHLFDVDAVGAELIRLADGSLSIDELSHATSVELKPADVASFFVALGQKGYLANTVLVNITETVA